MLSTQVRTFSNPIRGALAALAMSALVAGAAGSARAARIIDPPNDFIPSFVDPHDADLDVRSASAYLVGDDVVLTATMNGAIGGTANALYVWGVNRGVGVAGFGPLALGRVLRRRGGAEPVARRHRRSRSPGRAAGCWISAP